MFKRMSILVRHSYDSRDEFARKWEHHGTLVSQLPLIRSYVQNHVVEEFRSPNGIQADGIVELMFDQPEDMTTAFGDSKAIAVRADEPNFLGHGTGYALANDSPSLASPEGAKLIVTIPPTVSPESTVNLIRSVSSYKDCRLFCDDKVRSIIARSEMKRVPQEVADFLHLQFDSAGSASKAGRLLFQQLSGEPDVAIFRVRTHTVIPKT